MDMSFSLRKLTISAVYTKKILKKPKFKPKLNLCGIWLEKAGFEIGEQVTISVSKNLLIIKKIEK
jgi:toxic protein SymE